ncbi:helix-turn-helix domain-containing protein [Clostridioides difficile]|uniref:helix-turn-helix domain-containing protein n=1 Tax=Clostridioides difficile TaxID=1496 RepID=UPI0002DADAD3|nr:helix-turn-helix transcriptional regulator [Clostridioides difficile]EGT3639058.1 XRE family transcriptional regulator [Clostridioides difficile]EGT3685741.1 XRE family transcriptional regulator [Clostridioides difficile]MBY2516676.1 helix-turn-helix domain-containing protein [Clostridioides difficile]MDK3181986.1 helix-turn-helix transcriptional regulator [Clostridioides difficile]VIB18263.1 DNA-binding protein [Clostridioides difficile]
MNFGQRLKEIRVQKNLTGEELGKILNVTKVAISNWESGRRFPSQNILISIADYFNISLDFLLCRTNIKQNFFHDEYNQENLEKIMLLFNELSFDSQEIILKTTTAFLEKENNTSK